MMLHSAEKEIDEKFESILNSLEISKEKNSIIYKQLRMSFLEIYVMRYEWMRNLILETGRDDDDFRRQAVQTFNMFRFSKLGILEQSTLAYKFTILFQHR